MPLKIIHQDITKFRCDVIVNPTDSRYSGSEGIDYAIHKAAGPMLDYFCRELSPMRPGRIEITSGCRLPARQIIHTMGPVWEGGDRYEEAILAGCYTRVLKMAEFIGWNSVAFPLISSGPSGFPKDRVLRIATDAISNYLLSSDDDMDVFICIDDRKSFELSKEAALKEFLSRNTRAICMYQVADRPSAFRPKGAAEPGIPVQSSLKTEDETSEESRRREADIALKEKMRRSEEERKSSQAKELSLADWMNLQDDSFSTLLLKLIQKKGMDPVECYKSANLTKNTFWKIKNDPKHRPSRQTVVAFAIALKLTMEETEILMKSAGMAFARNNPFDMIVEFYILNGIYNVFEINEALYQYDQPLLGWWPAS